MAPKKRPGKNLAEVSPFTWYTVGVAEWTDEEDPSLRTRPDFPYWPLREHPELFVRFADLPGDQESFLRFALQYGPLLSLDPFTPDRLSQWTDEHRRLYRAVSLFDNLQAGKVRPEAQEKAHAGITDAITAGLSRHHVTPTMTPTGAPLGIGLALAFRVVNLIGGMWLQLAVAVDGNRTYRVCEYCGKRFDATDAPAHKRVCDDKCRNARSYRIRTGQWEGGESNDS